MVCLSCAWRQPLCGSRSVHQRTSACSILNADALVATEAWMLQCGRRGDRMSKIALAAAWRCAEEFSRRRVVAARVVADRSGSHPRATAAAPEPCAGDRSYDPEAAAEPGRSGDRVAAKRRPPGVSRWP